MRCALLVIATLGLVGPLAPVQNAAGHTCFTAGTDPSCDTANCPSGTYHYHEGVTDWCASSASNCPGQPTHSYGGVAAGPGLAGPSGVTPVMVWHSGTADCDGDGVPGGWDGDYESGVGGAFFGWGHWANDPVCGHQLNVHGGNVAVNDAVFGGNIVFLVGENDQNGPIVITDPVTGDVIGCETDGNISPETDADDCISPTYTGTGSTCGSGGGDGGFWVFIGCSIHIVCTTNPARCRIVIVCECRLVNPGTTGFITAY